MARMGNQDLAFPGKWIIKRDLYWPDPEMVPVSSPYENTKHIAHMERWMFMTWSQMYLLYLALSGCFGEKGGETEELLNRKVCLSPIFMNSPALIQSLLDTRKVHGHEKMISKRSRSYPIEKKKHNWMRKFYKNCFNKQEVRKNFPDRLLRKGILHLWV